MSVNLNQSYHEALEAAGHILIREEDGSIDIFRLEVGNHNGPECKLCGENWCHHCKPEIKKCQGKS